MKNKKLAVILGMMLMAGTLAGCGSDKGTENTAEQVTESAPETEESTEEAETADESETAEETEDEAATDSEESKSTFDSETVSVAGWNLTVEDVELNDSLENVSVELGYTGVETSDFQKEADEGKKFCLIKMKIEKDGSKESIDWKNMKLTDGNGNEYERMSDEFISDLGMMRMPGNTLNFGSNEGWIAYEINEDASDLELSYSFAEEEYRCNL